MKSQEQALARPKENILTAQIEAALQGHDLDTFEEVEEPGALLHSVLAGADRGKNKSTDLDSTRYLRELRRVIAQSFDMDELQTIAYDLGVNWDEQVGERKSTKARSLISLLARKGQLENLIALMLEERPNVEWPEIPPPDQQKEDALELYEPPPAQKALRYEQYQIVVNWDQAAKLRGFDLSGRDLSELELKQADLRGTDLRRTDLTAALLMGANLTGANLREADLREANLNKAKLSRADLDRADLREANLREADLREANLKSAKLSRADLREASLSRANLSEVDLREANLNGALLIAADLSKARMAGADLIAAQLIATHLATADLRGTFLRMANLYGADLSQADLREADLTNAKYNGETIWPEGFDPQATGAELVEPD